MKFQVFLHSASPFAALPFADAPMPAGGAGADPGPSQPSSGLQMADDDLLPAASTIGKVDLDAKIVGDKVSRRLEPGDQRPWSNAFWQSVSPGQLQRHDREAAFSSRRSTIPSTPAQHRKKHQEVSLSYEDGTPVRLYANPPYSHERIRSEAGRQEVDLRSLQRRHFHRFGRRCQD